MATLQELIDLTPEQEKSVESPCEGCKGFQGSRRKVL